MLLLYNEENKPYFGILGSELEMLKLNIGIKCR